MRDTQQIKLFMKIYAGHLGQGCTALQAYILSEDDWERENNEKFYKNYQSFRAAKSYYLKNIRPMSRC